MKTARKKTEKRLQVNVELRGEVVDRFLEYKDRQYITNNAAAGFKLLMERLDQVIPAAEAEQAAA